MPISRIAIYGVGLGLGTEAWGERKAAVPLPAVCPLEHYCIVPALFSTDNSEGRGSPSRSSVLIFFLILFWKEIALDD